MTTRPHHFSSSTTFAAKVASIAAIYPATEGEGVWVGTPQVMIRLNGCAVGCLNCDSKETWGFGKADSLQTIEQVLSEVQTQGQGLLRASITGGDPQHPRNRDFVLDLARLLKSEGYFVNLESAGGHLDQELFEAFDFISWDVKLSSTGVKHPHAITDTAVLIDHYFLKCQIKSVVESTEDFHEVVGLYDQVCAALSQKETLVLPWIITPAYTPGASFSLDFFHELLLLNQKTQGRFRIIGQQHKWIHGALKRNV